MDLVRLPPLIAKASAVVSLAAAALSLIAAPRPAREVQLAILIFGLICTLVSLAAGTRIAYQGYYEPAPFARVPRVSFERLRERMVAYLLGALVVSLSGVVMMALVGSGLWLLFGEGALAGVVVLFLIHIGVFAALNAGVRRTAREIELFGQ